MGKNTLLSNWKPEFFEVFSVLGDIIAHKRLATETQGKDFFGRKSGHRAVNGRNGFWFRYPVG
jgi:hypothetical protein